MGTYQIMEFRCRPGIIQYVLYEFGILYKTIQCHCWTGITLWIWNNIHETQRWYYPQQRYRIHINFYPDTETGLCIKCQFECFQELEWRRTYRHWCQCSFLLKWTFRYCIKRRISAQQFLVILFCRIRRKNRWSFIQSFGYTGRRT